MVSDGTLSGGVASSSALSAATVSGLRWTETEHRVSWSDVTAVPSAPHAGDARAKNVPAAGSWRRICRSLATVYVLRFSPFSTFMKSL